jgi:hypothetical protein
MENSNDENKNKTQNKTETQKEGEIVNQKSGKNLATLVKAGILDHSRQNCAKIHRCAAVPQARRLPLQAGLVPNRGKIVSVLIKLDNNGPRSNSLRTISYCLVQLSSSLIWTIARHI